MNRQGSARLIALLQDGEQEGFVELLSRFGRLFRWYFRKCGMSGAEAEDHAVDLLTDIAMSRIHAFKGDGDTFGGWLNTLMRHEAVNWHRRQRRLRQEPLDDHIDRLSAPDVADPLPDVAIGAAVEDALSRLAPRDRRLFEARAMDGMPFKDVASELQISTTYAKVKFHRIRRTLQLSLGTSSGS